MLSSSKDLYPAAFINWAGSKRGGVRTPFNINSGRPAGKKIETPLTKRLSDWVSGLVAGEDVPRAILLIGGPGNGKSDAVEACIELLDAKINAETALISRFSSQYSVANGDLPPRKSTVSFSDLFHCPSNNLTPQIHLVQDATEKDIKFPQLAPEALLNEELNSIITGDYNGIYICCVNRGILANASSLAHKDNNVPLVNLINNLVESASGGPNSPNCWPLDDYPIAIWPMDVESLVASSEDDSPTVMHQILDRALDKNHWEPLCENSKVCPFCQNRELLAEQSAQDNLVKLLYFYELCAGKRWTFRDLYSLVSYLFIGNIEELLINKKNYTPCNWTAKQLEIIDTKKTGTLASAKARYLLMGKLYHHRLFSLWPKFNKGKHLKNRRAAIKLPQAIGLHPGYWSAVDHFKALANASNEESSSIKGLLTGGFSHYLDPSKLRGNTVFFTGTLNHEKIVVTANLIDERFSLSIDNGLKLVARRLPKIEVQLLEQLSKADEYLMEHNHSLLLSGQVRFLQASIRQYASRLVKRSLGVKYGLCQDVNLLEDYSRIHKDRSQLKNTVSLVRHLINKDKSFPIPLSTTFGQPVAHRERDISLLVSEIKPKIQKLYEGKAKPVEHLPYIEVHNNRFLPITFNLFKSLREVEGGLNEASLPEEIFAMLDEVKSIVAGEIVRDESFLDSSVNIKIGDQEFELDVDDLVFVGEAK